MRLPKSLLVLLVIIAFAISGFALYSKLRASTDTSILGPVGIGTQQIMKRRYEQGKVIRVSFKDSVTDDQALSLMKEWQQVQNVNGSSFTSMKVSGKPLVDLFIVDVSKKVEVIQLIQQNKLVDKVADQLK